MKLFYWIGLIIFQSVLLCGCFNASYQPITKPILLQENWGSEVNLDPNQWTLSADKWYFTGEPNQTEEAAIHAPISSAMTIMAVRVSEFNKINIIGNFQIQIVGHQDKNTVFVLGPNEMARQAGIAIRNHTLFIRQAVDCNNCFKEVIVRIGMNQLNELCYTGDGSVTGRNIISDHLSIITSGYGNILLGGHIHLNDVTHYGLGTITIIGADSPNLNIRVIGNGNLNISGRVGVQNIIHFGHGQVNIAFANTNALFVQTNGNGVTTILGDINLRKVIALGNSQFYSYWINSNKLELIIADNAKVGLAGITKDLNVSLYNNAWFGGMYLHSQQAAVSTTNSSHANVTATSKLFATANRNSSIYYFSSSKQISRFTSQKGVILQAGNIPLTSKKISHFHTYK